MSKKKCRSIVFRINLHTILCDDTIKWLTSGGIALTARCEGGIRCIVVTRVLPATMPPILSIDTHTKAKIRVTHEMEA